MASLGYLMFGHLVLDEVTKSIMITPGFPTWINLVICAMMGILPVSKGPLITRPIITMMDQYTLTKASKRGARLIRIINRFVVVLIFFITSLVFTDFGRIISFLGSAICFAICIIFPLSFYLKLHYDELTRLQIATTFTAIAIAVCLAVCGTVAVAVV
jgi:vesicular inhibitory amino acid transporter